MAGNSGRRLLAVLAVAAVIVLAGCGGGGSPADGETPTSGTENPETETTSTDGQTSTPYDGQISNRLEVASATGSVGGDDTVTDVQLTVKKAPGADDIDLRNVTISWVESGGTYKIVHDDVSETATSADSQFGVETFKDPDQSSPVLNDPEDRLSLVFDLGAQTRSESFDEDESFGEEIEPGEIVTVKLTTGAGETTHVRLVVPDSLSGTEAVNL